MPSTKIGKVSIVPKGEYSSGVTYEKLDAVSYQGSSWLVLQTVRGVAPSLGASQYMLLASKGDPGTGSSYTLPQMTESKLGGAKAKTKTSTQTEPVGIDTSTGLLYTKPTATVQEVINALAKWDGGMF